MDEISVRDRADVDALFAGSPATRALLASVDWAATPLGPVEGWSPELRAAVRTVLPSEVPMLLWWGPELVQIHNQAFAPLLGRKHPAQGRRAAECWAEVWDDVHPMVEQVRGGGEATYARDMRLFLDRHILGEETYWTFSYSPVHDADGEVVGIFVATTDTTSAVIGERRLRALRELGALSAADVGGADAACRAAMEVLERKPGVYWAAAFLLDDHRTTARWTGGFGISVDGGTPGDLAGPSFGLPEIRDALATGRSQEIRGLGRRDARLALAKEEGVTGGPDLAVALPLVRREGPPLGVLVLGSSPHRVFDDEYRSFFELVGRQVSILVADAHAYRSERDRADLLEEADRAKTRFLQNVSHELRTPLTLLLGPIDDLLAAGDVALPADHREGLEAADRAARRLRDLVDGLLDVARGAAGAVTPEPEATDLAALTRATAALFGSAAEAAGLDLVVDAPALAGPVLVDREMWTRAVTNLVSNAVKFTPAGSVRVTLAADGDEVELAVRDTGIGVPPEHHTRVFERFHQVPGSRLLGGVGIGLAVVADVAHAHGGSVRVESAPGEGATFRLRIPQRPAPVADEVRPLDEPTVPPDAAVPLPVAATPSPRAADGRVLLVEDDADMRAYLRRLLLGAGWEVDAVADVDAALERAAEADVIVSDVMLPGRDGLDLVRAVRHDASGGLVPIILVTARAGPESAVDGLSAGADDYVVKPFAPAELVARVQVHMELSRLRAYALAQAQDEAANLRSALTSNRQIGAAVGILMQQRMLTADDAFALLRTTSQHVNRKLRDVAADVVETGALPDT